ncbi:MAG: glycosyltransferase [Halobacteriota archaeon]|nr:glycosyltransferase [Halobacteriota archaeon]
MVYINNILITVIVAVKNEERFIEKCLISLINQDFAQDLYQIVVVDGRSTDRTMDIVEEYIKKYPDLIKVYDNPMEWQAVGRNIAIQNEKESELITYLDGHCIADSQWLRTLFNDFQAHDNPKFAGVGSLHLSPDDESTIGKSIEQIFHTLFGGIGSSFRPTVIRGEVETVPFVLFKREALEDVGLYEEDMKVGEDFTLSYKLRSAGYKLFINPKAIVYRYNRNSFYSFLIQIYNYGIAKAISGKKFPHSLSVYHYLPSVLLIFLAILGVLGVYLVELRLFFYRIVLLYAGAILTSSIVTAFKKVQWTFAIIMPLLYVVEHFSYSIGFLFGIFKKGWKR